MSPPPKNRQAKDSSEESKASRLKTVADNIGYVGKIVAALWFFTLTILLVAILTRQASTQTVRIRPLSVPQSLAEIGADGDALAALLAERLTEMQRIQSYVRTQDYVPAIPHMREVFDIKVPGSGLTVGNLEALAEALVGSRSHTVTGRLIRDHDEWSLWLAVTPEPVQRIRLTEHVSEDTISAEYLVESSARRILELLDPYKLAVYLYQRDADACEVALRSCLLNDSPSDDAEAYNLWGLLSMSQGRFADAEKKLTRGLKLAGDRTLLQAMIYSNMGLLDLRQARYAEGRQHFERALEVDPSYLVALVNLGNAWLLDGRESQGEDARAKFLQADQVYRNASAHELERADIDIVSNWARTRAHLGDYDGALAMFQDRATRRAQRDATFYSNWGHLLSEKREYALATEAFEKALERSPTHEEATKGLAYSRNAQGDVVGALDAYVTRSEALLHAGKCTDALGSLTLTESLLREATEAGLDTATSTAHASQLRAEWEAQCVSAREGDR
jgi:tetratricopeptide (TPR) repeat protein